MLSAYRQSTTAGTVLYIPALWYVMDTDELLGRDAEYIYNWKSRI
jgi:hypothetical protein